MRDDSEGVPARAFGWHILWGALLALACFLAHELAFLFPARGFLTAVWPAGGIALAVLLLRPRREWPAILLILFLAGNAADLLSGRPFWASLGFMAAHTAESLACAWAISRWCGPAVRFERVREVVALIACATAVNACTACLGAAAASLYGAPPFREAWLVWWIADGLGILLVAPLVVVWADPGDWFRQWRRARAIEAALFLAVWCAAGWWAFQPAAHFHPLAAQPYMLVALLGWAALRLGRRCVTLALLFMAILAVTSKAVSAGPLAWGGADPLERLLAVQVCVACTAAMGLLFTAVYTEAQSASRAAREEHARLQILGDNLPHGMVYQFVRERDGRTRFLYVSAGVQSLTGVAPDEALRDPEALQRLILDDDRPALLAAVEASARDRSVFDIVVRLRRRDGELRWMHMSSTPRPLPDGRVLWDGIQLDVTDRKREEAARRESEGRFRLVLENAELPFAITAIQDGRFLFMNESAARFFGVDRAGAEQLRAADFWRDPTARDRYIKVLKDAGRVAGLEIETRTPGGGCRWAMLSANLIDYHGQSAAFAVLDDVTAIKEAAVKLERERAVLSAIFQTVPYMIWMKDAGGRYVACNPATEHFFELPASALIGKLDREIFPGEAVDVILAEDRAAIAAGGPLVAEAWVTIRGENRRVLLETTKTPMFDGDGRLAGMLCIARDVTESHLVREALRERVALQEQLEKIAAAAPGALFSFCERPDGTWYLPYASPAFEDIFGVSPGHYARDAAGFWDLLHPDDVAGVTQAIREARLAHSLLRLEYRVRHPKRGERWVEGRAVSVVQPGGGTVWDGFVMDISDRKRAEATLADEVVRRRILFEQATDGIAVLGLDGEVREANPAFARMLGYTQDEMCHLHVWDWNARWSREELLKRLRDLFAQPGTFETRHRRKDGSSLEVEVSASGAELGGHKLLYCVYRDITGRKAAEAVQRERRRLEGIGVLAGGMAHEFNNLLTVINGYSALLSNSFEPYDPIREQVDAIRQAGERAASLTQQLLAFGRKQIIRPRVVDLNLLVERSRPAWMPLLGPEIRLKLELDPALGLVSVDAGQMGEVLVNLVRNAVEALPGGGELVIGTANARIGEECAARHADARPGPYVVLRVADTGAGMDEHTRSRIFEPFFTTKDRATTTGLGLAIVHGAVAQHRGWVTVESSPGKGSVFEIYLPCVEEAAEPDRGPMDAAPSAGRHATILVVEDEDAVRRLTVSILGAHGYRVLDAATGAQAMGLLEGNRGGVQLILTDVILPGITGPELAEQLKSREPAAKVLYVSGYPESVVADYGVVAGDVAFIQKPYSPDVLVAKVRAMLG